MSDSTQVLIVGAGPVGLSAALALSKVGIDIRVVDAGPDVDRRMRASTFHPPTLDIIQSLGLGDELVAMGLKASRFQMRQHETAECVVFDLSLISDATKHPYRLQVEQHHYCDLAIAALRDRGVEVNFDTRVDSLTQDDKGVVVKLGSESVTVRWVIGSDGATSAVRKSLGLEYGGMTHTHSSVLVSTPFPFHEAIDNISNVSYCWSERGPFSLLRLRNFWRASLYPAVEDLGEAANESRVRDWLAYIHPDARDAEILDTNPYRVHERCVDRFRVGRVLLAGDAAHLNPPSGGMGMNGGIHDAMNLSGKLLRVINGADDSLLDRYDRQRHTLASQRIIPQASANRARMATMDKDEQLQRLADQRAIAADDERCRDFLLRSSMITGLREAQGIE
ncbi:MAG: FAD-dependent monooxygenase [Gammaproteobacteria bacterium]|nr:FAD-dependent monooxygenase [Gammaproteobacteria bacterium]